ncbi:PD-(D/E)XK motif protein [Mycolicibacterium sp. 120270]|uniref:PD-(D/E)XK motif protein n=1 Tax=Mycolicibacterium sp. 120270 TaxID=3090600 RepID=UPI00299DA72D|nr:PD-(D/E)XK motif protein [Mycolicibacterium sp. 120270]MDX1883237.1 PD-(D/E)XK motif protein [Mycolicibacterium sp. 120270]
MIDDVRIAFTALRSRERPSGSDLTVLPITAVDGIHVGLDEQSRQHLLLACPDGAAPETDIATLGVSTRNLMINGVTSDLADIVCLFPSLAEVFDYFVVAVIERVQRTGESPAVAVDAVLLEWRQFLTASLSPPSHDKLATLIGELLVVVDTVDVAGASAFDSWVGPSGARHDFRHRATAIEVKTTKSHTGYRITVHGEDQLMPPNAGQLFLHLVRLEYVPGSGHSVASLANYIIYKGISAQKVFKALSDSKISATDLTATSDVTFEVRERVTLPVDDRLPRIVPSSFVGRRRPLGVLDLSYVVDLEGQLVHALTANAYSELLATMGSDPAT